MKLPWIALATLGIGTPAAASEALSFDMAVAPSPTAPASPVDLSFQLPLVAEPSPPPPSTESPLATRVLAVPALPVHIATAPLPPPPALAAADWEDLFTGGSDSLVARAIGSAEGTRTPAGQRTAAYYGHRDPGNGAWNLGTFSYQHAAPSPAAADAQQLQRLRTQAQQLQALAAAKSFTLTRSELLNGLDLANQSPAAALDRGYIDQLHRAKSSGLAGEEAILWARTRSFLDPDTKQWNAPGLGNTVQSIEADQQRRMRAVRAVENQNFGEELGE